MTSKIEHKTDKDGRPYIEIGRPIAMRKSLNAAFDKFADGLADRVFHQAAKGESDEQIL